MINKISAAPANVVCFKQNEDFQRPTAKTKLSNYKDSFIQSSKSMLPSNIALAVVFALINSKKDMSKVGKALINNLAFFTGMSLIISGVDAFFMSKSNK